jgi:hypothetical protein
MAPTAAHRLDDSTRPPVDGTLSPQDVAELQARSARADEAYAQGECVDADVVLADLDAILSGA